MNNNLYFKKLINSFHYASEGIVYAINSERNMKIHVSIALLVLVSGMCLHFTETEVLIIFLCIAMVIGAEIFNTAIEKTVDIMIKDYHPTAKAAKDLAAGAVFLIVIVVIFVGIIVILPYLLSLYFGEWLREPVSPLAFFSLQGLTLILFTYVVKTCWYNFNRSNQPHALIGIIFILFALSSILFSDWIYYLGILFLIFVVYLLFKKVKWIVIIQNLIISIGGFYLSYNIFF